MHLRPSASAIQGHPGFVIADFRLKAVEISPTADIGRIGNNQVESPPLRHEGCIPSSPQNQSIRWSTLFVRAFCRAVCTAAADRSMAT